MTGSWHCPMCDGTSWKRGIDGEGIPYQVCVACSRRPTSPPPTVWPALDTEREEPTLPAVPHPRVREDSTPPTIRRVAPKKNG